MTDEEWRIYLDWLIEARDDWGALLFVQKCKDGSEQPVLMPAWPYPWWCESTALIN